MPEKHLSTQFDSELSAVSTRVMELGGLVESQIRQAIYALSQFSVDVANQVTATEARVNAMEVDIDRDCRASLPVASLQRETCVC
jgi:phosphate transport system protein